MRTLSASGPIHGAVALGSPLQTDGAVQDGGKQSLDVGADGSGPSREGDVRAQETAEADGGVLVLRDFYAVHHTAGADGTDGHVVRGHVPDRFEYGTGAVAAGQLADLGDTLFA